MAGFNEYGFSFQPLRGARAFRVDSLGRLTGINYRQTWAPGENVAECRTGERSGTVFFGGSSWPPGTAFGSVLYGGKPPKKCDGMDPDCVCGFYAYYDGSRDYETDATISGVVEGYGKCHVGTRGFRAEKARIVALYIKPPAKPEPQRWLRWGLWKKLTLLPVGVAGVSLFSWMLDLFPGEDVPAWAVLVGFVGFMLGIAGFGATAVRLVLDREQWRRKRADQLTSPLIGEVELTAELAAKVRRNYPGIPVFDSFAAMVKAYPTDAASEPSPETDEDFWTRKAVR